MIRFLVAAVAVLFSALAAAQSPVTVIGPVTKGHCASFFSTTQLNDCGISPANFPWVTVKDYGALCDGTTNDSQAFQKALNTGRPVLLPGAGAVCYVPDSVVLTSGNAVLVGAGQGETTIKTKAAPAPSGASPSLNISWNSFRFSGMSLVIFKDLTIDGNVTASGLVTGAILSDQRTPIEITNSANILFDSVTFTKIKGALSTLSLPNTTANVTPWLNYGQLYIANSTDVTLTNIRIKYPTWSEGLDFISLNRVRIDGFSSFADNASDVSGSGGLATPINIAQSSNVTITNFYLRNNLGSAINLGGSGNFLISNGIVVGTTLPTDVTGVTITATGSLGGTALSAPSSTTGIVVGQQLTGTGVPANTTVVSITAGPVINISQALTADGKPGTYVFGAGAGGNENLRVGGMIDIGAENSCDMFTDYTGTDTVTVQNVSISGTFDRGIDIGCAGQALGTYKYTNVLASNNIISDVPNGLRFDSVNGLTVVGNNVSSVRDYVGYDGTSNAWVAPQSGAGIEISNSINVEHGANAYVGGSTVTYGGVAAAGLIGYFSEDVTNLKVSNTLIKAMANFGIYHVPSTNNVDANLVFRSNDIIGSPGLAIRVGNTGVGVSQAIVDETNTLNGTPVTNAQAAVVAASTPNSVFGGYAGSAALTGIWNKDYVNTWEILGSTTGNGLTLRAAGTDTNVGMILTTKGSGTFAVSTLTTSGPLYISAGGVFNSEITLSVVRGGTGVATLTGVAIGNGTSAFTAGATQTCTNQFFRSLNSSYVVTCATVSLTADVTGTLPATNGGTGTATVTQGDLLYGASNAWSKLAKSTSNPRYLSNTGTNNDPAWANPGLIVQTVFTVAASGSTWTPNAATRRVRIRVIGAGGGGGTADAATAGNVSVAPGGGAGGYCETQILVPIAATITVGTGGTATNAGGTSSVITTVGAVNYCTATGGSGGAATSGIGTSVARSSSGGGGGSGSSASSSALLASGAAGGIGIRFSGTSGAGGVGGASLLGGQVAGGLEGQNGTNGAMFGGGGSGAASDSSTTCTMGGSSACVGGSGANGGIIIEEYGS